MPAWKDQQRRVQLPDGRVLIGASFRGVPFFVEEAALSGGRRTITHEFPFRDDPVIADQGRRARTFPVTGYIVGEDYLPARDALTSALEDVAGPGVLVLPAQAQNIRAICDTFETREGKSTGGMVTYTILFKEAPDVSAPVVVDDLDSLVANVSLIALNTIVEDLNTSYDVEGQTASSTASLSADVVSVATSYGELLGPIVTASSDLQSSADIAIQELAALNAEVASVIADANDLIEEPAALFERLTEVVSSISQTIAAATLDVFRAMLSVYDTPGQPSAVGDTPARELERANQVALGGAMREQALMVASTLIVQVQYVSVDDAEADREDLLDRLNAQILIATDAVYAKLIEVRATVAKAVPGNEELATVQTLNQRTAIPSIVLSHQLYGSVDGEQDILDRNPEQHDPGFLLGELQVLSSI